MIDERVYCETFSKLHASREAKEEVFRMMETRKQARRLPKVLRVTAMAAVMVMALAITAGAVNEATDGMLFRQLQITWVGADTNTLLAQDEDGNRVYLYTEPNIEEQVTQEDGRLILHTDQDIDITDELAEKGSYHYEYDVTADWEDGREKTWTVTIDVTGDPESWSVTRSDGDVTHTFNSEAKGMVDISLEARNAAVLEK